MRILDGENVGVDRLTGHGGIFSTPRVAQQILADALEVPIGCLKTASEGGAWGIAVLAAYRSFVLSGGKDSLEDWLDKRIFSTVQGEILSPVPTGVAGFRDFVQSFKR